MRTCIPWPVHQVKVFRVDQKSKSVDFHSGETRLLLQYLLQYFLIGPIVAHIAIVLFLTPKYCVWYYNGLYCMWFIFCNTQQQYFFRQILAQKQIFTVS